MLILECLCLCLSDMATSIFKLKMAVSNLLRGEADITAIPFVASFQKENSLHDRGTRGALAAILHGKDCSVCSGQFSKGAPRWEKLRFLGGNVLGLAEYFSRRRLGSHLSSGKPIPVIPRFLTLLDFEIRGQSGFSIAWAPAAMSCQLGSRPVVAFVIVL